MPLKDLLRARFTTALDAVPQGTWKILITDEHSQKLLDTVYKNIDILQRSVTSVEPLHSPRKPQSLDAVYLLTPTAQNVDRVVADFQGRRTYRSAHIFFIDGIDDGLAQRLTQSMPPDILRSFVELYCNFWALEDRVFSTKTPQSFFTMFGNPGGSASYELALEAFEDDIKFTGRNLLNLLATINENPHIRYYQPQHHSPLGALGQSSNAINGTIPIPSQSQQGSSLRWRSAMGSSSRGPQSSPEVEHISRKLAFQLQSDLDEYIANNPDFQEPKGRPKAVMFITDRSMDPSAPLLHEFWYQAMVNDLLPVKDGIHYKYTYTNTVGGKEMKTAELTEEDPVWVSVRHLHMKDAIDTLMRDFGKFVNEHAGFNGGSNVNINDLKDMLASLPQFQTQREQFSLHLDMAQECMGTFEKNRLNLAANVEQCCATGVTAEGKTPKNVVEEMVPLLADKGLSAFDKMRVIALYILFRDGVEDEDRRRLYSHARLSLSEQDAVNNMIYLGIKIIKDKERPKPKLRQKYGASEGEFELSRYKPLVQMVLEDSHNNRLDQTFFPFVRDVPPELSSLRPGERGTNLQPQSSLRSARPAWHKQPSRMANTESRQRMIIYIAGGVTYSEIRCAYTVGQALGKEIFIGSSHLITPESYLRDLKPLGRGGVGGNPPGGPPISPEAPRINRSPGSSIPYQRLVVGIKHTFRIC
ncbi:Sec1-like protein [Kockovaella imperatae]|uniref:Sec1-like protein n=1 Tax=Kockovaella imperatae TaxID=4999 RepID=A0A1Y1UJF2_9TREE|nr:Sec1-like protein [Kockovaella imperatae]ORX37596.1 Sec1-like protein [Kockovaella imperatae]